MKIVWKNLLNSWFFLELPVFHIFTDCFLKTKIYFHFLKGENENKKKKTEKLSPENFHHLSLSSSSEWRTLCHHRFADCWLEKKKKEWKKRESNLRLTPTKLPETLKLKCWGFFVWCSLPPFLAEAKVTIAKSRNKNVLHQVMFWMGNFVAKLFLLLRFSLVVRVKFIFFIHF